MDETDVQTVVRHFIDKERRLGLAVHAGRCEIPFAESAQFGGAERCYRVEKGPFRVPTAAVALLVSSHELARDLRDIRQLNGALDSRVAGQNLFEQSGACAR